MKSYKISSTLLSVAMLTGCASTSTLTGPGGPKIVSSGQATENGQYAEVGVQFTSVGDFFAVFLPSRWSSPIATGGSLSWLNPAAWSDDAGRTGRILVGEAVLVGGVAVAAASSNDSSSSGGTSTSGTTTPTPPTGGGGGSPPPPPSGF